MQRKLNILVIERSDIIRHRLMELLDDEVECNIMLTTTLKSAIELFRTETIDVVLLGNHLNDKNMLQLNIACSYNNSCLVVLSAYTRENFKTRYQYLQADYLFDKFRDFDKIPAIIANRAQAKTA